MNNPQEDKVNLPKGMLIFNIVLLLIWASFQYSVNNRVYAFYIILFFIVLKKARLVHFQILAASVFFILMFGFPYVETFSDAREISLKAAKHRRETLENFFNPKTGLEEVLPAESLQMLSIIKEHNLPDYRISHQIRKEELIFQRIFETAWPVKMDSSSSYLIIFLEEIEDYQDTSKYEIITRTEDVALVHIH